SRASASASSVCVDPPRKAGLMLKKILLADDSLTIQKVVELTFTEEDYDVVVVGVGAQAIQRIGQDAPDIVLADVLMPKKTGYEVCEFVKSNPATAGVPV